MRPLRLLVTAVLPITSVLCDFPTRRLLSSHSRSQLESRSPNPAHLFRRQGSCPRTNEVPCDGLCIPSNAQCCSGGSYCDPGYDCYAGGQCCPHGEVPCGDGCRPSDAVCCGGDGTYCPAGDYCDTDGCCPNGKTCSGGGGTIFDPPVPTVPAFTFTPEPTSSSGSGSSGSGSPGSGSSGSGSSGSGSSGSGSSGSGSSGSGSSGSGSSGSESDGFGGPEESDDASHGCTGIEKRCGDVCIFNEYTCCPDGKGGCDPAFEYCFLSAPNTYRCCLNGDTCDPMDSSVGSGNSSSSSGGSSGSSGSTTPTTSAGGAPSTFSNPAGGAAGAGSVVTAAVAPAVVAVGAVAAGMAMFWV